MIRRQGISSHSILAWFLVIGCVLLGRGAKAADQETLWIQKPIGEALEQAKRENKPALLYWGAIWCPPCNQLKAQVFSHPEFAAATSSFVRIYLDGDSAGAQEWSEKLEVSGYPTLLILAPEKSGRAAKTTGKMTGKMTEKMVERLRIAEFVSFNEFRSLLTSVLADTMPMKNEIVAKAIRGEASLEEWKMLAFTWEAAESMSDADDAQVKKTLSQLEKLFAACRYPEVRGLLGARLLNLATGMQPAWLDAVMADPSSIYAARGPYFAGALQWLEKTPAIMAQVTAAKLRDAAKNLRGDSRLFPAEMLQGWATQMDIENYMLERKWIATALVDETRSGAIEAAIRIEASSKSPYERHAVVSDAAGILASAGKVNLAKDMLRREAEVSDTPWYYQSSLAGIALEEEKLKDALEWSAKARNSAQGQATKLQWLVSDIVMQSKVLAKNLHGQNETGGPQIISAASAASSVEAWLELAKSLPDGFSGRNALRARKVKAALAAWPETTIKRETLSKWANVCIIIKGNAAKNCRKIMNESSQQ